MAGIYAVHYKSGTEMFSPHDDPTKAHVHTTLYPKVTEKYLNNNKQVDKWYWLKRSHPLNPCQHEWDKSDENCWRCIHCTAYINR